MERSALQVGAGGEPAPLAVSIHEEALLDLVQDLEPEVFRDLRLQKLKCECVDCSNEHLRKAGQIAEPFAHPSDNPLLEFGGGLVGERERNDVAWRKAASVRAEQMNDTTRDDFGLPEPAQAMSWRFAKPKPIAFFCDLVNFIDAPGHPLSILLTTGAPFEAGGPAHGTESAMILLLRMILSAHLH